MTVSSSIPRDRAAIGRSRTEAKSGGIAPDQCRWISCRRQFLLPVKVLSRLFRAKFVAYLKTAFREGKLSFHGELKPLGEKRTFFDWLARVAETEWVVYAKPPFGGP